MRPRLANHLRARGSPCAPVEHAAQHQRAKLPAQVLPLPVAVGVSSAGFAALHAAPGNLLPVALLSAACDVAYLRTASLSAPLALHVAWNTAQFAAVVLAGKDSFV
jgi:hypothetical protein